MADSASMTAARPLHLVAAGGTIAMRGERAVPALDGAALVDAVPELADLGALSVESVRGLPGAHMGLGDALAVARAAVAAAEGGAGVVVTHGTDTLEESAFLCDLIYAGDAPIVFTGAIRPASHAGADGPANLLDACAAAAAPDAGGLGVLVCFAGELHAARAVRKVDSTSPRAFGSPSGSAVGRVDDGRVRIEARPPRRAPLAVERLDARVPIFTAALGEGTASVRALAAGADGLVAVAFGAGHLHPDVLGALAEVAGRIPVLATVRPERGTILRATYGFAGAEADLRASPLIMAGALSPAAARIKLLACLGAGCDAAAIRAAFAPDD